MGSEMAEPCCKKRVVDEAARELEHSKSSKKRRKEEVAQQSSPNQTNGEAATDKEAVAKRLWGWWEGEWCKCTLLKITKRGKHKVLWLDSTTSVLDVDCIEER